MGKKADVWKAKYNELMRITESYIRHLHDAQNRPSSCTRSSDREWCAYDDDCDYDRPGQDVVDARIEELEEKVTDLEIDLRETDRALADQIAARERQEDEANSTISGLEGERQRLEYRVDELTTVLDDILEIAVHARATRVTVSDPSGQLDPGQRVHLFEGDWDRLIEACREARCVIEGLEGRA